MTSAASMTVVSDSMLRSLAELAHETGDVLSLHLSVDPLRPSQESLRLRAKQVLDAARAELTPAAQRAFDQAREPVEAGAASAAAGLAGRSMVLYASVDRGLIAGAFLPVTARDYARFGPGAAVLPVSDTLDELEPIVVCQVERNAATVITIEAGETVARSHMTSEVPQRTRSGGSASFWPGFERHQEELRLRHVRRVARMIEATLESHPTRKLYLSGTPEQVAALRHILNGRAVAALREETLRLRSNASASVLRDAALRASARDERAFEERKVAELVTRSMKRQQAVLGPAETAYAIQDRAAHELVVAADKGLQGRRCPACGHVGPVEESRCPVCQTQTLATDLAQELAVLAVRAGTAVEVVHWKAADDLEVHGGIGAFLKLG